MLNLLRKNPRQVLTRGQLLEKLWDIDERFVDEHTLTTSISRIRSKIESDGGAPYIKTVYGMGYQWTGRRGKMKFQNLSVKRLFGRVAIGLVLSMSGITIALFLVTKQTAVLLTGGALLLCALVGIFVLTQAFGKRLSQFTADLCQTLDHMIAGNEAPKRPKDSETQLARIGHRLARLYQIMQENRRRVDEERQELQTLVSDISHQVKTPVSNLKMATDNPAGKAYGRGRAHRLYPGNPQPDG